MTFPNPRDEAVLLPCPFCKGQGNMWPMEEQDDRRYYRREIICDDCGVALEGVLWWNEFREMSNDEASQELAKRAAEKWNNRPFSAAKPPADAVAELDAFYQGWLARWRDRLASLSPAATSGLAMPSREWMRDKVAADPDIEDCGAAPAATSGSAGVRTGAEMIARHRFRLAEDGNCAEIDSNGLAEEIDAALAKPASSPAGGDVRDGALGWNSPEEWEIEQRAFHAAGRDDVPKDVQELVAILWKQYCIAAEPSAALSPSTSAAEPVAWIANCCHCGRIVDTREEKEGGDKFGCEMSDGRWTCSPECWDAIVEPGATPPAPAAVDGQRVKALVWNEYETEGEVDRWDAETALGTFYEISTQFDGYHVARDCTHLAARFDTLDEAKAAAQADYESRIRACLATDKEGA